MNHPHPLISRGLLLAGAYNILGVLVFSAGFSNAGLSEPDPEVFSTSGALCHHAVGGGLCLHLAPV